VKVAFEAVGRLAEEVTTSNASFALVAVPKALECPRDAQRDRSKQALWHRAKCESFEMGREETVHCSQFLPASLMRKFRLKHGAQRLFRPVKVCFGR
jgi:hypothetical protein